MASQLPIGGAFVPLQANGVEVLRAVERKAEPGYRYSIDTAANGS